MAAKANLKELALQTSLQCGGFSDCSFLNEQIKGFSMNNVQMPQKPALLANSATQTHTLSFQIPETAYGKKHYSIPMA